MKIKIIAILITFIVTAAAIWLYIEKNIFRSKASTERVNVTLITNKAQDLRSLSVGDTIPVDVMLQSGVSLTGVDLHLVFYNESHALDYVSVRQDDPAYFEEKITDKRIDFTETNGGKDISKKRSEAAMVTKKTNDKLKKTATLHYIFKAAQAGNGTIRLRQDFSQIVGIGGLLQICKVGSVNCGQYDTDNDIALTNIVVKGQIQAAMNFKFQGINSIPTKNVPITVKIRIAGGPSNLVLSKPQSVELTTTDKANGIYTGNASFDVPPGNGYYLLVKGDRHVQKKICQIKPTETVSGTYHCGSAEVITLKNGDNTIDLSGIYQLVGDLNLPTDGQDGIVDSKDIAYIRQNLGSTDADVLAIADLNHDGIINQQDMGLVLASLAIKIDEE